MPWGRRAVKHYLPASHPPRREQSPGGVVRTRALGNALLAMPRPLARAALLLVLAGCAADVGSATQPVVYDVDDRLDVFEHPDATLRALARDAVVAFVPRDAVDDADPTNIQLVGERYADAFDLCEDVRFADQLTPAACSGTLIDEDLVLTVGHCVPDQATCEGYRFVFDHLLEAEGTVATVEADDVYDCAEVVMHRGGADVAVVRLDRPVVGRTPAPVRPGQTFLAPGDPVAMIGFGAGLPAKIDDGGVVLEGRVGESFFVASVDAFGGNSGSGVFDAEGRVVGMLSSGLDDFVYDGACGRVNVIEAPDSSAGDGETIAYAWKAMHALCREDVDTELCAEPASWCLDCDDGCAAAPARHGAGLALPLLAALLLRRR